jgi:hypothetical protein
MPNNAVTIHERPPSALAYMARALRQRAPAPGAPVRFGPIREQWTHFRLTAAHARLLAELTAAGEQRPVAPILIPQILGFRLTMSVLTRPEFPMPIWHALQIRNRLSQSRPIEIDAEYQLECAVGAQRQVDKGIEVDLDSRLIRAGICHWSGTTTFFYRGSYRLDACETVPPVRSPDLAAAPELTTLRMPGGGRWKFCQLTGDFNGIHLGSLYARRLRFAAAFAHPQRVAALCLRQIAVPENPVQSLDLWIKGPVYYDAQVRLAVLPASAGCNFGLRLAGDPRFALAGAWRSLDDLPPKLAMRGA